MRQMAACLFLLIGTFPVAALGSQGRNAAASVQPRINACSLLPTDLMLKVGGIDKAMVKYLTPEEEPMAYGSACEYASVRLQVRTSRPKPASPGNEWQAVAGVGDMAFFRRNGSQYAELVAWTASHYFTIQFGVPAGGTPESIRPNTIALANAVVAGLR